MTNNVIKFPQKKFYRDGDDYYERVRVNLATLAFMTVFVSGLFWTISTLLSIPTRPDCNFSNRRPCTVNVKAINASFGQRDFR